MTLSTGSWWLIIPIKWPAFFLVGMAVAARGVGFLDSHDFSVARSLRKLDSHTLETKQTPDCQPSVYEGHPISYLYILHVVCSRVWNGLFLDCQQTCRFFLHNRDRDIQAILQSCLVRIGVNGTPISALPYEMFRGSFTLILTRYLECLGVVYVFFSYGMTGGCYVT